MLSFGLDGGNPGPGLGFAVDVAEEKLLIVLIEGLLGCIFHRLVSLLGRGCSTSLAELRLFKLPCGGKCWCGVGCWGFPSFLPHWPLPWLIPWPTGTRRQMCKAFGTNHDPTAWFEDLFRGYCLGGLVFALLPLDARLRRQPSPAGGVAFTFLDVSARSIRFFIIFFVCFECSWIPDFFRIRLPFQPVACWGFVWPISFATSLWATIRSEMIWWPALITTCATWPKMDQKEFHWLHSGQFGMPLDLQHDARTWGPLGVFKRVVKRPLETGEESQPHWGSGSAFLTSWRMGQSDDVAYIPVCMDTAWVLHRFGPKRPKKKKVYHSCTFRVVWLESQEISSGDGLQCWCLSFWCKQLLFSGPKVLCHHVADSLKVLVFNNSYHLRLWRRSNTWSFQCCINWPCWDSSSN